MLFHVLLKRATLLLMPFAMAGCATTTASVAPTTDLSCRVFTPITWSAKDTDQTITGVKIHNAVWTAICGAPK